MIAFQVVLRDNCQPQCTTLGALKMDCFFHTRRNVREKLLTWSLVALFNRFALLFVEIVAHSTLVHSRGPQTIEANEKQFDDHLPEEELSPLVSSLCQGDATESELEKVVQL